MAHPRRVATTLIVGSVLLVAACDGTEAPTAEVPQAGDAVAAAADADCGVTELLVPECGAWFGATTPSADGTFDYERGLDEYEDLVGTVPDILHFYERGGVPFPGPAHRAMAERAGRPRSILYFSWKPGPDLTWRAVADGGADANVDAVAAALAAYPHRLFLTIHHEPENDVVAAEGSGMTPADYVDMYRHVVGRLRELGVDNVVYVMGYMGFDRWAPIVDALYPGDDVVDWIAWDPYGLPEHRSFADVVNDPNDAGWPGFYEWVTAKAPGTPLMLAEWGFNLPQQPWATGAVEGAAQSLRERFPAIKALVYWNSRGTRFDARLEQGGDDFVAAFARLAADPYFDRVSPADAP